MTIRAGRWAHWAAAVGALLAAVIHIPVGLEHLHEAPVMAGLFFGFVVVCAAGSAGVVLAPWSRAVRVALAVCLLGAVGVHVLSRWLGLPGQSDDIGQWGDVLGTAAMVCELLTVAALVLAPRLCGRRAASHDNSSSRPGHAPGADVLSSNSGIAARQRRRDPHWAGARSHAS